MSSAHEKKNMMRNVSKSAESTEEAAYEGSGPHMHLGGDG